jgi:hypothetical protein
VGGIRRINSKSLISAFKSAGLTKTYRTSFPTPNHLQNCVPGARTESSWMTWHGCWMAWATTAFRYGGAGGCPRCSFHEALIMVSSVIDLLNKMSGSGWFERLRICGQVEDICSRLLKARELSTDLVSRFDICQVSSKLRHLGLRLGLVGVFIIRRQGVKSNIDLEQSPRESLNLPLTRDRITIRKIRFRRRQCQTQEIAGGTQLHDCRPALAHISAPSYKLWLIFAGC